MHPIRIGSIDDFRLAPYRNLRTNKMERKAGLFIAEGMWLIRRLLESSFEVESLLVDERRLEEIGIPIPPDVTVYVAPDGMTERVVGFNFHRGVIACGRRKPNLLIEDVPDLHAGPWILLAGAEVQDPENVGSILRNAAAFGAQGVILGPSCCDPFSRRVLRVSMGASFQVPIVECDDLFQTLNVLRTRYQATISATVLDPAAESLESQNRPERLVLVFGSEGHGLADEWTSFCDKRITIPMNAMADSLNVSVASAIFLHYFTRIAK
jgi:tRNA G18 (ribose-2'-O)-methylase SpoU